MSVLSLAVLVFTICNSKIVQGQTTTCGHPGYLTQDNGIVDSHPGFASGLDYSNNMNCIWKIKAHPGLYVAIKAKSIDLEADNTCRYDYLELFDGDGVTAHRLGKFCGRTLTKNFTTSQNILTLRFRSDNSNVGKGFRLQYKFTNVTAPPICGHRGFLTQDHGIIDSHSGYAASENYENDLDCVWKIKAPPGMYIVVRAKTFAVENRNTCQNDYLEILDGDSLTAPSLGTFCGNAMTPTVSTKNLMTLHFVSDSYNRRNRGFRLHYNFTSVYTTYCPTGQFKCTNQNCVPTSYRCDDDDDCGDDSDEMACPRTTCSGNKFRCDNGNCVVFDWLCDGADDCGDMSDENSTNCKASPVPTHSPGCGHFNSTGYNGTVTSPNYPSHYPQNGRCSWKVQGPPGTTRISIRFDNTFRMEASSCKYDWVTIYSARHTVKHGPFCGTTVPIKFVVIGDHAFIEFHSDNSDAFTGFKIYWKSLTI